MTADEVSWSDSSDDFSGIKLIEKARTPRGRAKTDAHLIASVRDEIEAMKSEIIELSSANAAKGFECGKLEVDLGVVTQALNGNLSLVEKSNHALRQENAAAEREIAEKQALLERAKDIFKTLVANGVDMTQDDTVDYEYFFSLIGGKPPPVARQSEKMDPYVYRIVREIPQFKHCRDNQDFLGECRKLIHELRGNEKDDVEPGDNADYNELMERISRQYQVESAKIAAEVKALNVKKDEILQELDSLRTPKRVTFTCVPRLATPHGIKMMAAQAPTEPHRSMLDEEIHAARSYARTPSQVRRDAAGNPVFGRLSTTPRRQYFPGHP